MNALNALQGRVFELLSGDAGLAGLIGPDAIVDHVRTGRKMPHVLIAGIETVELAEDVEEVRLVIEVWSAAEGRKEVQAISERIAGLLRDGLAPSDMTIKIARAEKAKAFRAEISLQLLSG